ncbi:nuclear transport factor 2 family protein [Actinomadura rubteroloni]|nr:nuclear transport factor 2 family protein [Actinomadura rubteroloni]
MDTPTELIDDYFHRATDPDLERYFAQFAAGALVEDEGVEHRGIDAIRGWRRGVPPVRYEVLDVVTGEDGITTARADISGEFPGSPVTLTFRFAFDVDRRIESLTIRS